MSRPKSIVLNQSNRTRILFFRLTSLVTQAERQKIHVAKPRP
jgi:hypothetical protein